MDDFFVSTDNILISEGDAAILGQDTILSESETLVGPPGPQGPRGERGLPGKDGSDGRNATIEIGTTTTGVPGSDASVVNTGTETDAVLNFAIPRGERGIQGIQGEQGVPGQDGSAATITVGSVQTVASDYPATVTNSGTTSAAVLDFEIPQGIQGVAGQDGADGYSPTASVTKVGDTATITITDENGTTTASISDGQDGAAGTPGQAATITVGSTTTGAAGTNASVTNSGTSSAAIFNFTIPRGDTGAAGQNGQDGAAATVAVGTTTTGSAGTNASVTNSGTSSAAVLNFTIPRGDTGSTGPAGADGFSPTATTTQSGVNSVISITDKNGTTTSTVYGTGLNFNYSYNEIDTGTTWLQGQKIYSMTYYFSSLSNGGTVSQALPAGYTATVKIEGIMRQGSNAWGLPYPYCYFATDGYYLQVSNPGFDFTGMNALITLYYVKTQ